MTTIKQLHDIFKTSSGVCTDTRKIIAGCLFFALKGANFNGNLFAAKALQQGAKKVVVDEAAVVLNEDYILVDDVLTCLQELSTYHRISLGIPIVAITGSNGKTTSKELIKAVLDTKFNTYATRGNLNNHIGVPLTLLSLTANSEIGVVEMGANHIGEIAFLCQIALPNVGLITNVGKAHLEGFGSFEGVKKAKGELYRFIEKQNGTLFVNKGNSHLLTMLDKGAELFFYGEDEDCRIKLEELRNTANLSFTASIDNTIVDVDAQLMGGYNLENALAAMAIGSYFGVDADDIAQAICNYTPDNNRSQLVVSAKNKILFDAYNANPTSMLAALQNFVSLKDDNKLVILGEMKELGEDSAKEHIAILDFLRNDKSLKVYLIGENYKPLLKMEDGFKWFKDVNDLMLELNYSSVQNSFVLVKGSRSNQLEKLKEVL